jgi:hypothetical protein
MSDKRVRRIERGRANAGKLVNLKDAKLRRDRQWQNLETKTGEALAAAIKSGLVGASASLGVLSGVLRSNVPRAARARATALNKLMTPPNADSRGRREWFATASLEKRGKLADELVHFFEFVCRRGSRP